MEEEEKPVKKLMPSRVALEEMKKKLVTVDHLRAANFEEFDDVDLAGIIQNLEEEVYDMKMKAESKNGNLEDFSNLEYEDWKCPEHSVPIRTDVRTFDFKALGRCMKFDVIMMDPPWQLASSQPTRGVAIGYHQLANQHIANIPVHEVQDEGFIFIWVINARYDWTIEQMKKWGYTFVDEIAWVKMTVNRRLAKNHGYYLQHGKEICVVGYKAKGQEPGAIPPPPEVWKKRGIDVIYGERRGQSQKPEEIYKLIESVLPNGTCYKVGKIGSEG
uniref:mRNA m(6)A methyltransferase n=1 Tax=Palpitomonas bilix TaxID=652834 RepID=A0A7S3GB50_9EUKA